MPLLDKYPGPGPRPWEMTHGFPLVFPLPHLSHLESPPCKSPFLYFHSRPLHAPLRPEPKSSALPHPPPNVFLSPPEPGRLRVVGASLPSAPGWVLCASPSEPQSGVEGQVLRVPAHGAPLGTTASRWDCTQLPCSGHPAGGATTERSQAVLPQKIEIRLMENKQFLF